MQHYAFLVDDARFDEVLARIQERGIAYTADPQLSLAGQLEAEAAWLRETIELAARPGNPLGLGQHAPSSSVG